MMPAMFNKEIRYGVGRLIALPLLCIAAAWGVYALQQADLGMTYASGQGTYNGLFNAIFQAATTITCALIGLACGLWQIWRDTRPGAWAFLRHRPVPPARIFLAKLLAALVIYLAIVGIPIVGSILYAANSDRWFGPWLWGMAAGPLMDLFAGTVWIPVGMLIALRDARWFGSRIFPLGIGVLASIMAWMPQWWGAALAIAGGWAILLPAAWSMFVHRGREDRQPLPGRIAVGLTLIPAAVLLPIIVGGLSIGAHEMLTEQTHRYFGKSYQLIDGALYVSDDPRLEKPYRLVVDDEGNLVDDAPNVQLQSQAAHIPTVSYGPAHYSNRLYRQPFSYFEMVEIGGWGADTRRWFYLHRENVIARYHRTRDGEVTFDGYVGRNGASETRADVEPFRPARPTQHQQPLSTLLVEEDRVANPFNRRLIDASGILPTLFTAPEGERLIAAMPGSRRNDGQFVLAAATDAALYVVDGEQRILLRKAHEPGYSLVTVSPDATWQNFGVLYATQQWQIGEQLYVRVNAAGKTLARRELPTLWQDYRQHPSFRFSTIVEGLIFPPVMIAIDAVHSALHETLRPKHALCVIPAALGALLNFLLIRRDAPTRRQTLLWVTLGALGGFAGVLLLLISHSFSPRIACPHCRRPRTLRREICQHCNAPFPAPDTGNIGIFDSAQTAAFAVTE